MKRSCKEIEERYGKTTSEHRRFESLYDDVYKYGMPSRYTNVKEWNQEKGNSNREEIFTSVFEQSCDEFVQRVQTLLCPVNMDWIDFEGGYIYSAKGNNDLSNVNKELSKLAKVANAYKTVSNFDATFTEFAYDLVAGTGVLLCNEGTVYNPLLFAAIPFKEISFEEGADGNVNSYFRTIKLKNELVKQTWKDAKFEYEPDKYAEENDFIENCYYDDTDRMWNYVVFKKGTEKFIVEKTSKTSPFIDLRWSKTSNEIYGRGAGLKVINDVKTLNKITEYSLRALAFTVPAFTAVNDSGYDAKDFVLKSGAINPVPSNLTSNPTIKQLEVNPMPDLGNYHADKLTMEIKRNMYASTIPDEPSKMTATEVIRRQQELDNSLNNAFGRLIGFLNRLVPRIVEVLQKFGYISQDIDPRDFNGFGYRIKINTNLANQQNRVKVNDTLQALSTLAQFDPTGSLLAKSVKINQLLPDILGKMGVDNEFINTPDEINQLEMQQAQAMAQQQAQAMQSDVDISNAKEIGKADAQRYARQGL